MTSLIIGSSGQIGNHLTSFLKNKKERVLEFDISITHKHDLRIPNNTILEDYICKSDFIYFLAFDVGGSRYLKEYQNDPKFIFQLAQINPNVLRYDKLIRPDIINRVRTELNSEIRKNNVINGGSQFINVPKYGKRKVRYQKNGRAYVIVKGKKIKL